MSRVKRGGNGMRVHEGRTWIARTRHTEGVKRLDEAFAATPLKLALSGLQHGRTKLVRVRKGCPPIRDVEHRARHRRNKAARAARKRNRSRR